jgi:hypothetical protein
VVLCPPHSTAAMRVLRTGWRWFGKFGFGHGDFCRSRSRTEKNVECRCRSAARRGLQDFVFRILQGLMNLAAAILLFSASHVFVNVLVSCHCACSRGFHCLVWRLSSVGGSCMLCGPSFPFRCLGVSRSAQGHWACPVTWCSVNSAQARSPLISTVFMSFLCSAELHHPLLARVVSRTALRLQACPVTWCPAN